MARERAIGYIRVSTKEQARDGYSLANQRKEIKDYCRKNKIELVEVYADEGYSGADLEDRINIIKAMNHILDAEQNIKYLITWKLSRLSRRIYDVLDIVKQLDGGSKVLITVKDNINTTDEKDKHMLHFAAIFAEFERDTLIVQVKGGMEQKAREGEWNGGKAPLGYDLINKKLVINSEKKLIIEEIYKRYISGEGYKTIADTLNNKGLRTREGKLFSTSAVKFILTNPTYKGWVRWGYRKDWDKRIENPKTGKKERKRKYNEKAILKEGIHEAIISEERYAIVQELIENNPRRHVKRFQGHHLLSGLLRCPHCN